MNENIEEKIGEKEENRFKRIKRKLKDSKEEDIGKENQKIVEQYKIEDKIQGYIATTFFLVIGVIMLMGFLSSHYEYESYFLQNSSKAFSYIGPAIHHGLVEYFFNFAIEHPIRGLLVFIISFIGFIYFGLYGFIFEDMIKPIYKKIKRKIKKREIQLQGGII